VTFEFERREFQAVVDQSGRVAAAEITHFAVFGLASTTADGFPVLSGLNPGRASIGATIDITGIGFNPTASDNVVLFAGQNNTSVAAELLSATPAILRVTVPAGAVTGKVFVSVGSQSSNGLLFTVVNEEVKPTLTNLTPNTLLIGGAAATLTLIGRDFDPRATVQVDGVTVASTYVDSTRINTTVSGFSLSVGVHNLVVVNPGLDSASNALTFIVGHPAPAITGITPNFGPVGESIRITISGSGFTPTSIVQLDGVAMSSTYKNSTSLSAMVYSFHEVTGLISVFNPDPGGGLSNSVAFQFSFNRPTLIKFEDQSSGK
jgi:hypothetical protein